MIIVTNCFNLITDIDCYYQNSYVSEGFERYDKR